MLFRFDINSSFFNFKLYRGSKFDNFQNLFQRKITKKARVF